MCFYVFDPWVLQPLQSLLKTSSENCKNKLPEFQSKFINNLLFKPLQTAPLFKYVIPTSILNFSWRVFAQRSTSRYCFSALFTQFPLQSIKQKAFHNLICWAFNKHYKEVVREILELLMKSINGLNEKELCWNVFWKENMEVKLSWEIRMWIRNDALKQFH